MACHLDVLFETFRIHLCVHALVWQLSILRMHAEVVPNISVNNACLVSQLQCSAQTFWKT